MTQTCRCCGQGALHSLIDFGLQPPSNRYVGAREAGTDRHPLEIGVCKNCGLVQLINPMSPEMVRSRYAWLTYNEPENHLDELAERVAGLPGIDRSSIISGLTYKDDTTLRRLEKVKKLNTLRYEPSADLGITDPNAGLETIQASISRRTVERILKAYGCVQMLIVRHVLEHAHDPLGFLMQLSSIVEPGGYIVLEIPDATKFIRARDYGFIWEEHITYFTRETLGAMANAANLHTQEFISYSYSFEDSLIAILRLYGDGSVPRMPQKSLCVADAVEFGADFENVKERWQQYMASLCTSGQKIGMFGAGHLAAKFINLFELKEYFKYVIDDDPKKRGLRMPGSELPIFGSDMLESLDVCMLSLNPESEKKVIAKNQSFIQSGGQFKSIFTLSPLPANF